MNRIARTVLAARCAQSEPYSAFVYDLAALREHVRSRRAALPDFCRLYYAVKANPELPLLEAMAPHVDGFETASLGEIGKVRAVSGETPVVFGGPGKSDRDIEGAMAQGVRLLHVESRSELRRVAAIAQRRGVTQGILLRVNLRGPLPTATLAMGGQATQFGIDEARLGEVIELAQALPAVRLEGFHLHSLSNQLSAERHVELIVFYCRRVAAWAERYGIRVAYLNAGGGIGVNYAELERQFDWAAFAQGLEEKVRGELPEGAALLFECGRYLSAFCGYYAAEVLDVKENHGVRYAIVRGGTHHFRLPSSWQHSHPFTVVPVEAWPYAFAREELRDCEVTVAGELCTPKDILARQAPVDRVRIGDILLFSHAGAYGWTISHHDFLSHPHPAHVYLEEGAEQETTAGDVANEAAGIERAVVR